MKKTVFILNYVLMLFIAFLFLSCDMDSKEQAAPNNTEEEQETFWKYAKQISNLVADDDTTATDYFGDSISVSGNTAIIGARCNSTSGAAYIFTISDGIWSQSAKLTPNSSSNILFGCSVAVSGDIAIVGATGDDDKAEDAGAAYIFTRTNGTWTQTAKLTASDATSSDYFGSQVAISGNTAIVGAYNKTNENNYGEAYIFTCTNGTWTQTSILIASDATSSDNFGASVSISDDTAIVGAPNNKTDAKMAGAAYVFTLSDGVWSQSERLQTADVVQGIRFGSSVSISGDSIIVGAINGNNKDNTWPGAAYVFTRSDNTWTEKTTLTLSDSTSEVYTNFGCSVSISGTSAIVGANADNDNGENSGAVYLFEDILSDGSYKTQTIKLKGSDTNKGNGFGTAVAISDEYAFVGAPDKSTSSAYIFQKGTE
ncbi:MAG: FG-GAP repeat protein [Spirochaetales bacterium]|nr:FG-GAP repeat protein [Spirochaetales bacterium]